MTKSWCLFDVDHIFAGEIDHHEWVDDHDLIPSSAWLIKRNPIISFWAIYIIRSLLEFETAGWPFQKKKMVKITYKFFLDYLGCPFLAVYTTTLSAQSWEIQINWVFRVVNRIQF